MQNLVGKHETRAKAIDSAQQQLPKMMKTIEASYDPSHVGRYYDLIRNHSGMTAFLHRITQPTN